MLYDLFLLHIGPLLRKRVPRSFWDETACLPTGQPDLCLQAGSEGQACVDMPTSCTLCPATPWIDGHGTSLLCRQAAPHRARSGPCLFHDVHLAGNAEGRARGGQCAGAAYRFRSSSISSALTTLSHLLFPHANARSHLRNCTRLTWRLWTEVLGSSGKLANDSESGLSDAVAPGKLHGRDERSRSRAGSEDPDFLAGSLCVCVYLRTIRGPANEEGWRLGMSGFPSGRVSPDSNLSWEKRRSEAWNRLWHLGCHPKRAMSISRPEDVRKKTDVETEAWGLPRTPTYR